MINNGEEQLQKKNYNSDGRPRTNEKNLRFVINKIKNADLNNTYYGVTITAKNDKGGVQFRRTAASKQ